MDPLSICAAAVAFCGAANGIIRVCGGMRNAPADIRRVASIVGNCRTVVQLIQNAVERFGPVQRSQIPHEDLLELQHKLEHSITHVTQLEAILNRCLSNDGAEAEVRKQRRWYWMRKKSKVESLLKLLNEDHRMFSLMLPILVVHLTAGIQDNMATGVTVNVPEQPIPLSSKGEEIGQAMTSHVTITVQDDENMNSRIDQAQHEIQDTLSASHDQSISDTERRRNSAAQPVIPADPEVWEDVVSHKPTKPTDSAPPPSYTNSFDSAMVLRSANESLRANVSLASEIVAGSIPRASACQPGCPCRCHHLSIFSNGRAASTFFGLLRVETTGSWSAGCDEKRCKGNKSCRVMIQYQLPLLIWSRMIGLTIKLGSKEPIPAMIYTLRVIDSKAELFWCSEYGRTSKVVALLEEGKASPYDVNKKGVSALSYALTSEYWDLANLLLQSGAPVDNVYSGGIPMRQYAMERFFQLRFEKPDYEQALNTYSTVMGDATENMNFSRLHLSVLKLSTLPLKGLLESDTRDIDEVDSEGRTALWWAARLGFSEAIELLFDYGADAKKVSDRGVSLLHLLASATQLSPRFIRKALENGCDINARDSSNLTPIMVAASDPTIHNLEKLLEEGADMSLKDDQRRTALHRAAGYYNSRLATQMLLKFGAYDYDRDYRNNIPLLYAINYDSWASCLPLVEYRPCSKLLLTDQNQLLWYTMFFARSSIAAVLGKQCWARAANVDVFTGDDIEADDHFPWSTWNPEYRHPVAKKLTARDVQIMMALKKHVKGCRSVSIRSGKSIKSIPCGYCRSHPPQSVHWWTGYDDVTSDVEEDYYAENSRLQEISDSEGEFSKDGSEGDSDDYEYDSDDYEDEEDEDDDEEFADAMSTLDVL